MEVRGTVTIDVSLSEKEQRAIARILDGRVKVEKDAKLIVTVREPIEAKGK